MPVLTDVINNYTNGSTGTINDAFGESVTYSISGNATNSQGAPFEYDADSGRVYSDTGAGSYFDVTLARPINGLLIEMRGSDLFETYAVRINGVPVNLNTMIANGQAIFSTAGAGKHFVDASGNLSSLGIYNDGSIGYVQFTIPISQIGIQGVGVIPTGGFDDFEIGIVPDAHIVCFCTGSMIETIEGLRPVETLRPGDLVMTLDHGPQPIRWIGESRVDAVDLILQPKLRPIRIRAGALGPGLPARDLLVSRQHRILLRSDIAVALFGTAEILVPAVKLLGLPGVEIVEEAEAVSYWHVLLDQHELIFSEGAVTESLFTGKQALKAVPAAARDELIALGFWDDTADLPAALVRTEIRNAKAIGQLLTRHAEARQPLVG